MEAIQYVPQGYSHLVHQLGRHEGHK